MSVPAVATALDKTTTADEAVSRLRDGMTIGIGGWASRSKPMSLVRAILRSDLKDLTLVAFGGPELGMLCAAGKVKHVIFPFASLDSIPLEPYFRKARESGKVTATELDEGMLLLGLQAAAWRLPFLPTRVGLGSDLPRTWPELRTVRSPYPGPSGEQEELFAVPAIHLDAALVHATRSDSAGNGQFLGNDPYFDDLFLSAATENRFVSCEAVVPTEELTNGHPVQSLRVHRLMVDAVVEAPGGAHPTSCAPYYSRDDAFLTRYAKSAKDPEGWQRLQQGWLQERPGNDQSAPTQERNS